MENEKQPPRTGIRERTREVAHEENLCVMKMEAAARRLSASFPGMHVTIVLTGTGEPEGAMPLTHFTTTAPRLRIGTILRAALRKLGEC